MASVLIGGMCTVQNGAFEMRAGQQVQFYFSFETNAFHLTAGGHGPAGTRKRSSGTILSNREALDGYMQAPKLTSQESLRNEFHKRQLGTEDGFGGDDAGAGNMKKNIAYVKPYLLDENGEEHYGDKIRVFAKCINGARPFEMVDLMLMTQSL